MMPKLVLPVLTPRMTDSYPMNDSRSSNNIISFNAVSGHCKPTCPVWNPYPSSLPWFHSVAPHFTQSTNQSREHGPKALHDCRPDLQTHLMLPRGNLIDPISVPGEHHSLACLRTCMCYFFCLESFASAHPSANTVNLAKTNSSIRVQFKSYIHPLSHLS